MPICITCDVLYVDESGRGCAALGSSWIFSVLPVGAFYAYILLRVRHLTQTNRDIFVRGGNHYLSPVASSTGEKERRREKRKSDRKKERSFTSVQDIFGAILQCQ